MGQGAKSSNDPISFSVLAQGAVIFTVYVFVVPFSAVTTMGIGFATPPPTRGIRAEGTPEVAGESLIVNVAVESSTVAVTVVFAVVFGARHIVTHGRGIERGGKCPR